jgi:uncharacterized protein YjbI with pentapeptide repeats
LSNANLSNVNLQQSNLIGTNLSSADLSNSDLINANLHRANLQDSNLVSARLYNVGISDTINSKVDFSEANLSRVDLSNSDLRNIDFNNANLSAANLIMANLKGANLNNLNVSEALLVYSDLSNSNLSGVDLSNKDLTGVNLSGVDLSNKDLTGTILNNAKVIDINLINLPNSIWSTLNGINDLTITRYDFTGDTHYLATKEGFLFEGIDNKSKLALDLNKTSLFPFTDIGYNAGLLSVASNKQFVYISYVSKGKNFNDDGVNSMVDEYSSLTVDEYSKDFKKARNIIKIDGFLPTHYGGDLAFDQKGRLYLSTGDGRPYINYFTDKKNKAQKLNDLRGKILRLDVSKSKRTPEILAYGLRNPFGISIDSKDRMFITPCGRKSVESVYLLKDLDSVNPVNFGWPIFEGSLRKIKDLLEYNDIEAPILELT